MLTRRNFIKRSILCSGVTTFYFNNLFAQENSTKISWDRSVCKFCSLGCGILVGKTTTNNIEKIISIKGDKNSPVNKGLLCEKAYAMGDLIDSSYRITTPLLKNNTGIFEKISWEKAFDIMEEKAKYAIKKSGVDGVGVTTSGFANIEEGYVLSKLFKAGFRTNNIFNTSSYSSQAQTQAQTTIYGTTSSTTTLDEIENTDTFVSWGLNLTNTYPIIYDRISQIKLKKQNKFNFINITTIQTNKLNNCDFEIFIKPSTDILLINYILRELVYNYSKDIDFKFIEKNTIFTVLGDKFLNTNSDRFEQWETSFYEYKKSLEKYTLEYIAPKLKANNSEDLLSFKEKLKKLASLYISKNKKILSYWSSGINKQKNGLETNLSLHSLHLILNKHSRKGCGAVSLDGQVSTNGTSIEVGTFSNRLPSNMYIKYKEHRVKAEHIWHLPEGTLNPVATNNSMQLFDNIKKGVTKFVWITNSNPYSSIPNANYHIKNLKQQKDCFVVTSDAFMSLSATLSDLILPSALALEKFSSIGNTQRDISLSKQQITPKGKSMSDIWQFLEFAKRFTVEELWGVGILQNGHILKDVIHEAKTFGYNKKVNLYKVLFANFRAKAYKIDKKNFPLNSEAYSDNRNLLGSEGFIFSGYRFFIQKYLFEEYRLFGSGVGHDLAHFDKYFSYSSIRWPYLYDKSTNYRFNTKDDIYAKIGSKDTKSYLFYGKMGGKKLPFGDLKHITTTNKKPLKYRAKIFTIPYIEQQNSKTDYFNIKLTFIKIKEHYNTGNETIYDKNLYYKAPKAIAYINAITAKRLNIKDGKLYKISSYLGTVTIKISINKRFEPQEDTLAVSLFDKTIFINSIVSSIEDTFIHIS